MNIEEILQELSIPTAPENHHHATTNWIQIDCPYCSPSSNKFRLGIHRSGKAANCWVCGRQDIVNALSEAAREPSLLARTLLRNLPRYEEESKTRGELKTPSSVGELQDLHVRYLEGRGFNSCKLQNLWSIQGIGMSVRCSWSIYIPIFHDGRQVSWTTRSISKKGKYISASPEEEAIPHKELLFGEDYCRHTVIVCEGPFDVFKIGPGAVCTFGTSYTQAQLLKISKYPKRVILFDQEPTAQIQAQRICAELAGFSGQTIRVELRAKDPGNASQSELDALRAKFLD